VSIFKKIGKAIGKIAHVALPILKLGAGFIPGVGGVASAVLNSKAGKLGAKGVTLGKRLDSTMKVLKASPVMPGGAVATPSGVVALNPGQRPPEQYSGSSSRLGTRVRKAVKKRKARRKTTTRKGRKSRLKFGSAAYRKKYLGHR